MDILIALLFITTVIATFLGLIKPSLILRWDSKPNRWKVLGLGMSISILIITIVNLRLDNDYWYKSGKEQFSKQNYKSAIGSLKYIDSTFVKYDEVQTLLKLADSIYQQNLLVENEKSIERDSIQAQQILEELETPENVEEALVNLADNEVKDLLKGSLEKSFSDNIMADSLFKITLIENLDIREDFIQIRAQEQRKKLIDEQFGWGGRHKLLTYYIKDNMHDPKSFDHVSSVYDDKGDYLLVQMRFRGKNQLGALVLNQVIAKTTIEEGHVLEIVSYQTL
ncbi:MAG: hypothetical protein NXI20_14910 [bacterium]|nr:hypothetical protein [bacterium]